MASAEAHPETAVPPGLRPARPADEAFLLRLTDQLGAFPVPAWRTSAEIASADHHILLQALHHPTAADSLLVAAGTHRGTAGVRPDHHPAGLLHPPPVGAHRGPGGGSRGSGPRRWGAVDRRRRALGPAGSGIDQITLNVFARNQRARAFYDRLGYQEETVHYRKGL